MFKVVSIPNTHYFSVEKEGKEPWVVKPSPGSYVPYKRGVTADGLAWFFDPREGVFIYDANAKKLVRNIKLPPAVLRVHPLKPETRESHDVRDHHLMVSNDGRHLFYLAANEPSATRLEVVDLQSASIVRSIEDLPDGNFQIHKNSVVNKDGKIVYATVFRDVSPETGNVVKYDGGLVVVDPLAGTYEVLTCEGSPAEGRLHSPSPRGRYWLRVDNSRIPRIGDKPASDTSHTPDDREYFSYALEIWDTEPFKPIRVVAPMWVSSHELPDPGNIDPPNASQDRLVLKKAEIYRTLSKYLEENQATTLSNITRDRPSWLWPDEKSFYNKITCSLSMFTTERGKEILGWQNDEQAFWLERGHHLVCVGIDGTFSPRTITERYARETNEPGARLPHRTGFDILPDRKIRLQYGRLPDGKIHLQYSKETVIVDGAPENATVTLRIISREMDQFQPVVEATDTERLRKLSEKADKQAKDAAIYRIHLNSLDEADCILAIDNLTSQIEPDFQNRAYDKELKAKFKLDGKWLNEEKFFAHVTNNCKGAAPALARLVDRLTSFEGIIDVHYKPYDDICTAVFGYGVLALAKLDPSSHQLVAKYGLKLDNSHEEFFLDKTLRVVFATQPDPEIRLNIAESFLFYGTGNYYYEGGFWRFAKMGELASARYSPEEYAERLWGLAKDNNQLNDTLAHGSYVFENIAKSVSNDATDWEVGLLATLKSLIV